MADQSTEALLEALFEGRWPADENPYRLNSLLGLKPWYPPLTEVWVRRNAGPEIETKGTAHYSEWQEARALLLNLHRKYKAAKGGER